jgi:hypothetical protein
MSRRTLGVIALAFAAASGCGAKGVEQSSGATNPAGAVDVSLPKEAQAKQQVIRDILLNLQEGYPAEKVPFLLRGVRFDEQQSRFLDGAKYLVRWEFNGPPSRDEVPVVLSFAQEHDSGADLKKVERIYVVKGSHGRYAVTRK